MESRIRRQLDETKPNQRRCNAGNRGQIRNTRWVEIPHKPSDECVLMDNSRMQAHQIVDIRSGHEDLHSVAELNREEVSNATFRDDWKNEGRELPGKEHKVTHGLQQPCSVVRWERFLPQQQLKVLLVEYDDSTRHVVTALLHNCSYEVTSAASGLKAWNLMENPNNHFDLVLAEVMVPCLSGIELLYKIKANKAFNHIPVIMMSSHDSMGIVFKCLSKGAVDFLVKPIRKNELKNLWQHVWRRCHNPSGSASRSGCQTKKIIGAKVGPDSGNNSCSSEESDNVSDGLNIQDGSDKGSGTQSSWTERIVEVESTVQGDAWGNIQPHFSPSMEFQVSKDFDTGQRIGQELQIATPRLAAVEVKYLKEETSIPDSVHMADGNASSSPSEGKEMVKGTGGSRELSMDLIGAIDCQNNDVEGESGDREDAMDEGAIKVLKTKEKSISDSNFLPKLELSLKRERSCEVNGDGENRRVLKHSGSSAFSRYNTPAGSNTQLPSPRTLQINLYSVSPGYGGYSFIQGTGRMSDVRFAIPASKDDGDLTTPVPVPQLAERNENENNLTAVDPRQDGTGIASVKEEVVQAQRMPGPGMPIVFSGSGDLAYDGVSGAYGSMHPMFYSHSTSAWDTTPPSIAGRGEAADQSSCEKPNVQPHDHCHSHHHSHHQHQHHTQHHCHHHYQHSTDPLTQQQDEKTITNFGSGTPCGSSTIPEPNIGQNGSSNGYGSNGDGHGSANASAVGSNNVSNNHNANSNVQTGANGDSGTQNGNSGMGSGSCMMASNAGSGVAIATDENWIARREAALTKFRQKRKERCFEKKVRYQSRKRLAEQRPRVRGQFVRQSF